jgi:Leucine rich repeat
LLSFAANAQKVEIECNIDGNVLVGGGLQYRCRVYNSTITENYDEEKVVITGNHFPGRGNVDVNMFEMRNFNIGQRISSQLFTNLPNLVHAVFDNVGITELQSNIEMESVQFLYIIGNPYLTAIQSHAFPVASRLRELFLFFNSIEHIHENAFVGLHRLEILSLQRNRIHSLHINVFRPLKMIDDLTLTQNQLKTILGRQFFFNQRLRRLALTSNQIDAIESNFMDPIRELNILALSLNRCISNTFFFGIHSNQTILRELQPCFDNFDDILS